ncbi:MAG: prepilin-type N-terminal cleavage/methylation domain-containing protein [Alphaproteobacteria bacterium]|nr:prepilin-type N-terminal cleavage/methylation domain-containing protein [Alphaproteobacteria bacterium]
MRDLRSLERMDGQAGLTLVEVIVALAIVALMTGVAAISVGGSDRGGSAEAEALRLSARLGLAVDVALIEGQDVVLRWDERGYEFITQAGDASSLVDGRPLGGRRELVEGLDLAGSTPEGAVTIQGDGSHAQASFVVRGRGAGWRVTFDGLNAVAERMSPA